MSEAVPSIMAQSWPWGSQIVKKNKEKELGSSDKEASSSASKNIRVVLIPYCQWKCVPTAISGGVDIS